MNQLTTLAWKEWRESRSYLWLGLAIFIGFPLVAEFEMVFHTTKRFDFDGSSLVVAFGGVLAVIVSVGSSCRDLHGRLEDFWRSRPIGVVRWWLVKYVVGLAIVVAACAIPIVIELCFNRDKSSARVLVWYPSLWAAVYSVGFLAGCVVRRTAHAATLALAGLLLIYLMPVVFPPLQWLNAAIVPESHWPYIQDVVIFEKDELLFALGMTGLAIVGLTLAIQSMQRDWHVQSGRKMMYGLVATALLLLFASAAFQLGTNLPILQQVELPTSEHIEQFRFDRGHGVVLSWSGAAADTSWTEAKIYRRQNHHVRSLEVTDAGIQLGKSNDVDETNWYTLVREFRPFSAPLSSSASCQVNSYQGDKIATENDKPVELRLNVFNSLNGLPLQSLHLWQAKTELYEPWPFLHIWGSRLYVVGSRLVVLDIKNPQAPQVLSDVPFRDLLRGGLNTLRTGDERLAVTLMEIPGLPPEERLKIALQRYSFDGTTLCVWHEGLIGYHVTTLTPTLAVLDAIGRFTPSLLEKVIGVYNGYGQSLSDGLLYEGGYLVNGVFNSSISVFDTRGPKPMQQVGHFAAPGASMVRPLPDGRAIVAGENKLWLIGPPPKRGDAR